MTLCAINTYTGGLTNYSGTEIDTGVGIGTMGSQSFIIAPTTLYELTGADDAGSDINAYTTTGHLTLASNMEYNIPKCSFAAQGSGTVSVARFTKEKGAAQTPDAYTATLTSEIDQHEMGLETRQIARSYQFKVSFSAASPGSRLETFDVYVNPARHRKA